MTGSSELRVVKTTNELSGLTHAEIRQRASLALDAGQMATFEWHVVSDAVDCDAMFCALFQLDVPCTAEDVFGIVHRDDLEELRSLIKRTLDLDEDYNTAFRIMRADGTTIWVGARGRVVKRDADGAPLRLLGVTWDMTKAKDQEDRLNHLVREMNHRVNNAFALMEAMLSLGAEATQDVSSFVDTLTAQVHALSSAHQLAADFFLHRQEISRSVELDAIIRKILNSWMIGPLGRRIVVEVEPHLTLHSKDITSLAMILYELATNAVKHSVLGREGGTLEVIGGSVRQGRAYVQWIERLDGPRASLSRLEIAAGSGLGGLLTEHCIAKMNADLVQNEVTDAGFSFIMEFDAATDTTLPSSEQDG